MRELAAPALRSRGFTVDRGPDPIVTGKGELPGEWSFALTDRRGYDAQTVRVMVIEATGGMMFSLRKPPDELNKPGGESTMPRMRVVRSFRA